MVTKAKTLRDMRLGKRLTQKDVAAKLKVSQGHYSAIERGKKASEVDDAMKVVNKMRFRGDRTGGGEQKAGRQKP